MFAVAPAVAAAVAAGDPVVALESTLIAHGLPQPDNLTIAAELEAAVRAEGALPATVAVLDGAVVVGCDGDQLRRVAEGGPRLAKLADRDVPLAVAAGRDGATTVSATAGLAARAGVSVFATGGLGGVHREAATSFDESADLLALARTPVVVVCAGVKSILDAPATLERLETLGVPVVGYRTDRFPGFYLPDSGCGLDWRVERPEEVAAAFRAGLALGGPRALVVANPVPADSSLDPATHDAALAEGLQLARRSGVTGKAVTPFLIAHLHRVTGGASLRANVALALSNARLAGRIAAALAGGALAGGAPGSPPGAAPSSR